MAELWALLHFIMPTLFDSHDEFNEWFSKDIESHAENKTGIDESKYGALLFHYLHRNAWALPFCHVGAELLVLAPSGRSERFQLSHAWCSRDE
jgi:hypothetical protein